MAGQLSHFEIYGDEPETLAAFYREVLGWRIERADGVEYWRIQPGQPAAAAGGLTFRPAFAQRGWMNFVEVDSLDQSLCAARRLGGTILKDRTAVPLTAWHAVVADPAGNAFAIWQPDPTAFPPPEPD